MLEKIIVVCYVDSIFLAKIIVVCYIDSIFLAKELQNQLQKTKSNKDILH